MGVSSVWVVDFISTSPCVLSYIEGNSGRVVPHGNRLLLISNPTRSGWVKVSGRQDEMHLLLPLDTGVGNRVAQMSSDYE